MPKIIKNRKWRRNQVFFSCLWMNNESQTQWINFPLSINLTIYSNSNIPPNRVSTRWHRKTFRFSVWLIHSTWESVWTFWIEWGFFFLAATIVVHWNHVTFTQIELTEFSYFLLSFLFVLYKKRNSFIYAVLNARTAFQCLNNVCD